MARFVFGLPPMTHIDDPARGVAAARMMITTFMQEQEELRKQEKEKKEKSGLVGASGKQRRNSTLSALEAEHATLVQSILGFGVAVTTGHLFYGMVGSEKRMEVALHGPAVTRGER